MQLSWLIPESEVIKVAAHFRPRNQQLQAIAVFLRQQVDDRFRNQGGPSQSWPPKRVWQWGHDDRRLILTGASAHLRESFESGSDRNSAWVVSFAPHARVHQLGTVGKGGQLPTIRPKRAKALFIPITDRAIRSIRLAGRPAALFSGGRLQKMRVAVKYSFANGRRNPATGARMIELIPGKLDQGRLVRSDGKKGTPDFIFLTKVDIPPRPMLPTANREKQEQLAFIKRSLHA